MATSTAKYGLTHPSDPDPADVTSVLTVLADQIDSVMAGWNAPGLFSARPAASLAQIGRFYYATDVGRIFMCVSTTLWIDITGAPVGTIYGYPSITPPDAFHLYCNGQAVLRAGANAALFAKIGTDYGVGNGTTTFNVPDYRGRVLVGADDGANRVVTAPHGIAGVGGEERHLLSDLESGLPFHNVNAEGTDHTHAESGTLGGAGGSINFHVLGSTLNDFNLSTGGRTAAHIHSVTAANASSTHQNMPPFQVAAYMIRI